MAPPLTFDAAWRHAGVHRRYGHTLDLWLCPDAPQAWHDAYRHARGPMVGAGYSWTDRAVTTGTMTPCWWDTGIPFDAEALRIEVDRVVAEQAAAREERARIEQERLDAEAVRLGPLAAPIRAELAEIEAARPWLMGRQLKEARVLLGLETWTVYGMQDAERHLSNAKGNAARAEERLGRTPPQVWYAKAADEGVRAAALEACRVLSGRDEDWAAVVNNEGWSQSTTWSGHLLSERPSLDQAEAAHALQLLHGHRKQLSDEHNMELFGEVPVRRRRRVADPDAGSLQL